MIPKTVKLKLSNILDDAKQLSTTGVTQLSNNKLFYLNINDDYIHQLFPQLNNAQIEKPNYFGKESAGAHITIIYPEEHRNISPYDLNIEHEFKIKELVTAEIKQKIYYVLLVESPSLSALRKKYKLPELLDFKGYSIGFHITIGKLPM